MIRQFLSLIFILSASFSFSQKYNFVNWTVEDGLIQSQASFICQDHFRQLWIGTEGGISIFDGKKFSGLTVQNGLVTNRIITMFPDSSGNMWIGTNNGLQVFNGKHFKTIKAGNSHINNVYAFAQSGQSIYVLNNFQLFEVGSDQPKRINITKDTTEKITALHSTQTGDLLTHIHKKGIYYYHQNKWSALLAEEKYDKSLSIRKFFISTKNDTFLLTNKGLYIIRNKNAVPYPHSSGNISELNIICISEDNKQNIWLGTDNGVFKIEGSQLLHFNEKSGFTDNSVNTIYKDAENNLWFGTNGDGIFKFRENTFTYYDKSTGLKSAIVMGVAQTADGRIYAGGYGGGLYEVDPEKGITLAGKNNEELTESKINCLYADINNTLLIGTLYKGAWRYSEKEGAQKLTAKNAPKLNIFGVTCFLRDRQNNLLIGSQQGLYAIDQKDSIQKIKLNIGLVTTLKQFDQDHILVGTAKGLYLLDQNYSVQPYHESEFGNASILCLAKNNNNIWIGTTDKGVINWNYETGKIIIYNTNNGLPSNFIYSIDVSGKNRAWIGTGFGISNIQLDHSGKVVAVKNYGRSDGLLGMECNHNSLLKAKDSSLWFGTTKGLFHFNPYTEVAEKNRPIVFLKSVKLFSSDIKDSTLYNHAGSSWFNVPEDLKLGSKQNHLTFELGAIYFTNPDDVLFKYKLLGADKDFTSSNNPLIIYPSLPPGKYTLQVIGITKSGVISSNTINYTFEIQKAFYQTSAFQFLVILLLIGSGALVAYIITRNRQKRKQKNKEILEKIREEEFIKLRQRTAEDFHDEMGNSLTRISVLTDVLKTKINGKEQDVTKLVQQIKENTTALYNGSRDIIWSLNSQNDGIYEIAEHIKDIGNELFQDTNLDFQYQHNISSYCPLKLKLDYSRNLTMIFKEAYSNILKHSKATVVKILVELKENNDLHIFIRDNGEGFDSQVQGNGNGIKNMNNRANRMNGIMTVNSAQGKGTEIQIILKNIFV